MKNKLIVITGCSGGGKSTLIDSLNQMGYTTIPEAGRILVKEQIENNGGNLPQLNPMGFCNLLIEKSIEFYKQVKTLKNAKDNVIFFDRSFLDPISYYQSYAENDKDQYDYLLDQFRFNNPILMTPPWKDIFSEDSERKHTFEDAISEYDRLKQFYPRCGYMVTDIPKASIDKRIALILSCI